MEDLTDQGQTNPAAVGTRRHDEPVDVELVGLLCPGDRSAQLVVDEGDEPAQWGLPEILEVLMQGRYPVVLDEGGFDGVRSVLEHQQRAGKLCVGGWHNVPDQHCVRLQAQQEAKVARTGLGRYLDVVLTSGELGVAKPDPRIFDLACRHLGVPPKRAVYVGDRLDVDALAATTAGLRGVWLNRTGRPARPGVEIIGSLLSAELDEPGDLDGACAAMEVYVHAVLTGTGLGHLLQAEHRTTVDWPGEEHEVVVVALDRNAKRGRPERRQLPRFGAGPSPCRCPNPCGYGSARMGLGSFGEVRAGQSGASGEL